MVVKSPLEEVSPIFTEDSPLTLREALATVNAAAASPDRAKFNVQLVCGFNPLHLQTFLNAHLQIKLPARRVELRTGLYDDFWGTLSQLKNSTTEACAILLEWPDLDARLGFRRLGGWGVRDLPDIVAGVESKLLQLQQGLQETSTRVALCGPTLRLPPLFHAPAGQLSSEEVRLTGALQQFFHWAVEKTYLKIVNPQHLSQISPPAGRLDLKGDLLTGSPYSLFHSERVASILSDLLIPVAPKKGIITDLDGTLWAGLVGEVGAERISWDLASGAQVHGLYQQVLRALSEQGVLLGVASKNNYEVVKQAFDREDLVVLKESIFPVEVNWKPKSESVGRILQSWNISADSVVFIDDSPMELAEVKTAFPDIECIHFNAKDFAESCRLLYRLRNLFAKDTITAEDELRTRSLSAARQFRNTAERRGPSYEEFMQAAQSKIVFSFAPDKSSRSLELVNKTNQFNLNGIRFTETEWQSEVRNSNSFCLTVNYKDKYGPLGVISVLKGHVENRAVCIDVWVMSCRAFARRIEHRIIALLFEHFGTEKVFFNFSPTERNGPLQEFFAQCMEGKPLASFTLRRDEFLAKCPALYQEVSTENA